MKQLLPIISILLAANAAAQQSNHHFSHTDSTFSKSDRIWQVWTDIPNWEKWDKALKEATIKGPFAVGAIGKLTPDKGPASKFIITEIVHNESYTFKTRIPFGWLVIKRKLEVKEGITRFTHDVEFTGIFRKAFGKKLGENYRKMLPAVMHEIKQIAEAP